MFYISEKAVCLWFHSDFLTEIFRTEHSSCDEINLLQRATEKTVMHIGFANFFCMAAVDGDTL